MEQLGLELPLDAYVRDLDIAVQQMIEIAKAFSRDVKLIIMDEPTTALDVVVQREIIEEISELRRDKGFSVIFITHDLPMLLEITDKICCDERWCHRRTRRF